LLNPPVGPAVNEDSAEEKEDAVGVLGDLSVMLPYPPVIITYDLAADEVVFDDTVGDAAGDTYDTYENVLDGELDAIDESAIPTDQTEEDAPLPGVADVTEDPNEGTNVVVRDVVTEDGNDAVEEKTADPPVKRDDPPRDEDEPGEDSQEAQDDYEVDESEEVEVEEEEDEEEEVKEEEEEEKEEQEDGNNSNLSDEGTAQAGDEEEDREDVEDDEEDSGDENTPTPEDPRPKNPRPPIKPEDPPAKDPRPKDPRPPTNPAQIKPIPPEELNGPDGKPPNPFKPIPKKPDGDKADGGKRPENPDRPERDPPAGGRPADDGRPGGPSVQPLMGGDDDENIKEATKGKPKKEKEKEDRVPFVEPLLGEDGGEDGGDPEYEFDDSLAYEDMDYVIPRFPWEKPTLDLSPWGTPNEGAEDGPGDAESNNNNGGNNRRRSLSSSIFLESRRQLLLADPITSLGSSGFSYVIVTATSDGVSDNMTMVESSEEAVGASILSRIRAIQVVGESAKDFDSLEVLWNVLFWSAILLAGVAALHLVTLGVLRALKVSQVPKMLHVPRIELLTFTMILPMIAAAGAIALRSDSAGTIAAGVCFGILLPFGFLIGASLFLIYAVFRPAVSKRRAVYVLSEDSPVLYMPTDDRTAGSRQRKDPSGDSSGSRRASVPTSGDEEENSAQGPGTGRVALADGHKPNLLYKYIVSPLFGFDSPNRVAHVPGDANISPDDAHLEWMGRGKTDGEFVKRFGLFFEDAHGPQVVRVQSRYDWSNIETDGDRNTVGGAVLVPSAEGAMEILQTFAIIFAATKMVLFAIVINAPGGVNHFAQVIALALVCLLHIAYLRICVPYRLRIELVAELVAAVMDLAVFVCGIILVAISDWSSGARNRMGTAMIVLQAIGFLVFITVRLALAIRTCCGTFSLKNLSRGRVRKRPTDHCKDGPVLGQQEHAQGVDKVTKV
jgi:hypothetical protein